MSKARVWKIIKIEKLRLAIIKSVPARESILIRCKTFLLLLIINHHFMTWKEISNKKKCIHLYKNTNLPKTINYLILFTEYA